MRPTQFRLPGFLLLLALISPALTGCGSGTAPGDSPSASASGPTSPAATTTTTPSTDWTVLSDRLAYDWRWPNADLQGSVTHTVAVPPVPELVVIGVDDHPTDGDRPYNRMSFSFTTAFPSYQFQFVRELVADGSGQPIPLAGAGVLRIVFTPAQAHTQDGTTSTIVSQPPAALGLNRMMAYAQAGDFEGHVSYGIGIGGLDPQSNPQIQIRVHEVTLVNGQGGHRYVVALDVDAR